MRRIRMAICLLFAVSCLVFGIYTVKSRLVEDHRPPVITCEENEISVSVDADEAELLAGVTAEDDKDGDITKSIRVSSMSNFVGKGKRTVTYAVFDKANQAATAKRTLTYTDYRSPRIYLTNPMRFTEKEINTEKMLEGLTAEDCLDGDLTKQIYITWNDNVYSYQPGTYLVTLQVSNSAGDVCAVPVEVTVVDHTDQTEKNKYYPMLSEYIVYTKVGKTIEPVSYLTGVANGNGVYSFAENAEELRMSKEEISIQSQVDYEKPGVYPVQYSYTNQDGAVAVTKLFVVVEE